jgi:hypothetical protein
MDRIKSTSVVVFAAVLLLLSFCEAARAGVKLDSIAKVASIEGEVLIQKGGKGDWSAAAEGAAVRVGDVVKTGAKSSCVLTWNLGNTVKLSAFTVMKVARMDKEPAAGAENSQLDLWAGGMHGRAKKLSDVNSSFEVHTPTAIAGVRGTKLAVEVGADESTDVKCLEGSVYVKSNSGGEVFLKEKEKTSVKKNEPPVKPELMDEQDQQEFEGLDDSTEASLEIMQPVGNLETDVSTVKVKGTTDPGAVVTVNGQVVTADQKGSFEASVELTEGTNQIKIESANKKGKVTTKTRVVKYKPKKEEPGNGNGNGNNVPPAGELVLTVSSPRDGQTVRDSSISVTGTVSPGASVSVNGMPVAMQEGVGSFSASAMLVEGENRIEISARLADKSQSIVRTVVKDTTPPMLIVIQPPASFGIGAGGCAVEGTQIRCTVMGQTEPDAQLMINGATFRVESDGSFRQDVTMSFDKSTMDISVSDAMGNRTTVMLTRTVERSAVSYLEVTVTPGSIVGDGQSEAAVTVRALNILREPVDAVVTLRASGGGGRLGAVTLTTSGGTAATTFTAGVLDRKASVTITAASGAVSASAALTVTPDRPPIPKE